MSTKRHWGFAVLTLFVLSLALTTRAAGTDRGGIDGDPIALDWIDSRYSDFLVHVKRRIQERWGYPCVPDRAQHTCEYLNAHLVVEFGILKSGQVQYVDVVRSSGYALYDDRAVSAIWAASPYPPIPPEIITAGSTGLPIRTQFNYVTEPRLVAPRTTVQPLAPQHSAATWPFIMVGMLLAALVVAAAACARMLWRRRITARERTSDSASRTAPIHAPGDSRRDTPSVGARVPRLNGIAHAALRSHGWQDEGETVVHGLDTLSAHSYSHPELEGHRVNVSSTGHWEHTKVPEMPARGSTPEELAHHLGAIHGTLSIADLHLPGRRAT